MKSQKPRIAIPEPSSIDVKYSRTSWPEYASAVEQAGGDPVQLALGDSQAELARLAASCSAVLLPGSGADVDPEKYGERRSPQCGLKDTAREAADELLLQDAFNLQKPIFGICYGLQSLNVWRGGSLIQHLPGEPGGGLVNHSPGKDVIHAHWVSVSPGSLLGEILESSGNLEAAGDVKAGGRQGRLLVNSSHHQAVKRAGDHLRIAARSVEDGIIEALEGDDPGQFVLGVQWHPERVWRSDPDSRSLFHAFTRAAEVWRIRPIRDSVPDLLDDAQANLR